MTIAKPLTIYNRCFGAGMPIIGFTVLYLLYGLRIWDNPALWLISLPLIFLAGYIYFRLQVHLDTLIQSLFPALRQTVPRVLYSLLANTLMLTGFLWMMLFLFRYIPAPGGQLETGNQKYIYMTLLMANIVFYGLWEVNYIIDKFKESTRESEIIQQMQMEEEFDDLKERVNPHFLFNSFNTLSSLITEDREKAEKFLDELSKVYRYLLKNNADGMSSLESELKFIQSYFQLLKTRYGEAVNLRVEVEKQYNTYLLPSLSLQMLVENAVKHNALSRSRPLFIEIFTTVGNKLVVNNNLQRRTVKPPGGRVGLENIRSKYALLAQTGFRIMEDEKNFTVVLPLIWSNSL